MLSRVVCTVTVLVLLLATTSTTQFACSAVTITAFTALRPFLSTAPASSTTSLAAALDIKPGQIVEYALSKKTNKAQPSLLLLLGAVLEPDGKRNWKVLTSSGLLRSVPPKNVRHILNNARRVVETTDDNTNTNSNNANVLLQQQVAAHEDAAEAALANDKATEGAHVTDVWEMLVEEEEQQQQQQQGGTDNTIGVVSMDLASLAELIIGNASSTSCYAARLVLTKGVQSGCFKEAANQKGQSSDSILFEPRTPDVVEALRSKARAEAEVERVFLDIRDRIEGKGDGPFCINDETKEVQLAFAALERLACLDNMTPKELEQEAVAVGEAETLALATARTFLKQIGLKATTEAARTVLVKTGVWHAHQNLDVIRQRTPLEFPSSLEAMALELAASPPIDIDMDARMDLTHLPAFAIDEASTVEIDDAISVEMIPDSKPEQPMHKQQRLWIHIADPTRYIALGTPLDKEARKRGSSLYLPTGTVPMFPMIIASGPLCLNAGEVSCALSVGVMLDAQGGIDDETPPIITPSLVRTTRLTNSQVDKLLDPFGDFGDETSGSDIIDEQETVDCLRRLEWASEQRLGWRKAGGSLESIGTYEFPDMRVKVWPSLDEPEGWGVSVSARTRHASSRLVTELMLLANEAIAAYGDTNGVPMGFRSQETDEITDLELESTPEGPCRAWLAIRSTYPSQISSTSDPHGGLGLDHYVQATSPVRRYGDLALHHQLKAHLRGDELPFPATTAGSSKSEIVSLAQNAGKASKMLERSANTYWLREFLRRRQGQPVPALVLSGDRRRTDLYKLLLTELGEIITYQTSRPLTLGSEFELIPDAAGEFN